MSRLTGVRWLAVDLLATVVLLVSSAEDSEETGLWGPYALVMVVSLILARHRPLIALLLSVAGAAGHHLPEATGLDPLDLAVPVALFAVAASERPRRVGAIACGLLLAGIALTSLTSLKQPLVSADRISAPDTRGVTIRDDAPRPVVLEAVEQSWADRLWQSSGLMLVLAAAYLLGDNLRGRRMHLRTLERRAADLEREQRQRVALATAAERARITRELHDVVAHGLSVMVVQAQGAAAALKRRPDRTEHALRDIVTTGRSSLAEMRRLLAIVREEPELAPQPGVEALPELIDRIRAAGTTVTFTVEGEPAPLPAGVDLSAYRIAQEALTNTLKHAGPGAGAAVRLGFHAESLEIEVSNDGLTPEEPVDVTGNGLRGIAERVRLLDGELRAGVGDGGGFRVLARLPLRPVGA